MDSYILIRNAKTNVITKKPGKDQFFLWRQSIQWYLIHTNTMVKKKTQGLPENKGSEFYLSENK